MTRRVARARETLVAGRAKRAPGAHALRLEQLGKETFPFDFETMVSTALPEAQAEAPAAEPAATAEAPTATAGPSGNLEELLAAL